MIKVSDGNVHCLGVGILLLLLLLYTDLSFGDWSDTFVCGRVEAGTSFLSAASIGAGVW